MANVSLSEIYRLFPTKESCFGFLESIRWKSKPRCPHCGSSRVSILPREFRYHCNVCNRSFSVTVKTLFHNTRIPLQKWLMAIDLFLDPNDRLSVRILAEKLEINKNSAWMMLEKLKLAFNEYGDFLAQVVEAWETLYMEKVGTG